MHPPPPCSRVHGAGVKSNGGYFTLEIHKFPGLNMKVGSVIIEFGVNLISGVIHRTGNNLQIYVISTGSGTGAVTGYNTRQKG